MVCLCPEVLMIYILVEGDQKSRRLLDVTVILLVKKSWQWKCWLSVCLNLSQQTRGNCRVMQEAGKAPQLLLPFQKCPPEVCSWQKLHPAHAQTQIAALLLNHLNTAAGGAFLRVLCCGQDLALNYDLDCSCVSNVSAALDSHLLHV